MAKVALITDTHAGIRNDSEYFADKQEKFYSDIFFPELERRGITTILHGGDAFDRRKYVNFNTLYRYIEMFASQCKKRGIKVIMIAGNHDTFFKNSNHVNSPELLLKDFGVESYSSLTEIEIDGRRIVLIPWINNSNYESVLHFIDDDDDKENSFVLGHFEFSGFEMHKGHESLGGMRPDIFKDYLSVMSGHYHTRSSRGNVTYMGAPFEYTWNDYNDARGFHILDTDNADMEYIVNPHTVFEIIEYNGTAPEKTPNIEGKIVKVIATAKDDYYAFDQYVIKLNAMNPHELQVIDHTYMVGEKQFSQEDLEQLESKDNITLLREYVASTIDDHKKVDDLNKFIGSLHATALDMEAGDD